MSKELYDPIRKLWVAAEPEEYVRQALIKRMVSTLGYPESRIGVEKALGQLPHLTDKGALPDRRLDLICYAEDFSPLLLVECKAVALTDKVMQQLIGYNNYVAAPFIAAVNKEQIKMGWWDFSSKSYQFIDWLPTYRELISNSQLASSQ